MRGCEARRGEARSLLRLVRMDPCSRGLGGHFNPETAEGKPLTMQSSRLTARARGKHNQRCGHSRLQGVEKEGGHRVLCTIRAKTHNNDNVDN